MTTGARARRFLVVASAAVLLPLSACGTRMSHQAIVAAGGGQATTVTGVQNGGAPGAGGVSSPGGGAGAAGAAAPGGIAGGGVVTGSGATGTAGTAGTTGTTTGTVQSGSRSGGATVTPTGAPLVIASVGDYSGIAGSSEKDGPKALQVWAAWTNAHGGINGHPVKVYVVDDGMDPQRYQAAVKDLVENKHVIAFVDNFAPFTIQAGVKYLESKHVPVVGGDCAEYIWNQSPMLFPQCPSYVSSIWGIPRVGAVYGKGKNFGAIICSEAAACTATKHEWVDNHLAEKAGMKMVYEADVSIGQPDFTAECIQAQQNHVQVMSVVADVGTVGRLVQSCDRQGFHPQYVQGSGTMDAHLASLPGMSDALVQLNDFPWTVSNPAVQEFRDAYKAYAPNDPLTPNASQGWASAVVFAQAAAHVSATPTSAEILAGLWSMRDATFGGLTPPLTFVRNKPAPDARCSFAMQVQHGVMQAPFGLKTVCR
jgi:branched-chain amino acid transport system substrate-binding protein